MDNRDGRRRFAFILLAIAISVTGAALLCVLMEVAYRLVSRMPPPTWEADADLIYKLNPGNPLFPQSFRGKAPSPRKTKVRIVCLGASTTFAPEFGVDQAWPAVLERVLKSHGIDAEVINAGVPGYGSRQLLLRYRRDIAPLHPDYVILYEGWNRTGALVDPELWTPFGYGSKAPKGLARFYIARHSLLLQKIIVSLAHLKAKRPKGQVNYHVDWYQGVWAADFKDLVEEIHSQRSRPVLVRYPALHYVEMTPAEQAKLEHALRSCQCIGGGEPLQNWLVELDRKHRALQEIARATGTPLMDVQGALSSYKGRERKALFVDIMHLTVLGHQAVGEIIGQFMASLMTASEASAGSGASSEQVFPQALLR